MDSNLDSNLLKEAIADAKAVRQTALANAKVALEEAFNEKYQAMFSEKLKEDAAMGTNPTTEEEEGIKPEDENVSSQEIEELIKELESEVGGGGENPAEPSLGGEVPPSPTGAPSGEEVPPAMPEQIPPGYKAVPGAIAPIEPAIPGAPEDGEVPPSPATPPPSDVPQAGAEEDEDVNLDELLESLKEEIEKDNEEEEEEGKKLDEDKKLSSSAIAPGGNKKPSASASSSSNIETGGMKNHGLPDSKVTSHGDDPTEVTKPDKNFGKNKDGNLATNSPLKETIALKNKGIPDGKVTSHGDDPTEVTFSKDNIGDNKDGDLAKTPSLKEENESLKRQLAEHQEVIKYVKTQINEVNLLNAKLLYTNKLFKEFTMNNEQKMTIVEMFDLAKNVREVKMTYTNLAESLNFGGTNVKKKAAPASNSIKSITEGLASKSVGSTKPSKQIISESESSQMASRFQKLAGIKVQNKTTLRG